MEIKKQNGFTFVEILIVLGITAILAVSAGFIYGNFQVSAQLNESSAQVIQTIRTARQRSISRVNNSRHGVKLQSDRYILYQGSSYSSRDSDYDREIILGNSMSFSTTLVNDEINFSKGLGVPDNSGNIILSHDTIGKRTIIINAFGMVEER